MQLVILCILLPVLTACGNKNGASDISSLESPTVETDEYGNEIDHDTAGFSGEENSETNENGDPIIEETIDTIIVTIPETTREPSEELPEVPIYDHTVLDNYVLNINKSERYTVNYPEDFTADSVDKYKTFLVKENTQIFFYCINNSFTNSDQVYYSTQVSDELYRFPYAIDNKDYTASVMSRKNITYKDINGKNVARETPLIEFSSKDARSFVRPVCISYFTTFDNKGFAILAVSTDKTEDELDVILTDMISTLGTYTPSKYEAEYEFNGHKFVANDSTGISFSYPDGWVVKNEKNGFVSITAPSGSLYDGAKIIYKSDAGHEYVTDFAQFANITKAIAPIYMTASYDEEKLATDFLVMSMDDGFTLDGSTCYLFQIEDHLMPLNKTVEILLPSMGEYLYSYRYTFESKGIPVMVSFQYTTNNQYQVRDLADNIMSDIVVR